MSEINMENPHEMKTTWLIYLCCYGVGVGSIGSPLCNGKAKICCIKQAGECDLTTDIMGDGGMCLGSAKTCCLVEALQFIPAKFFIELCGMRLVRTLPIPCPLRPFVGPGCEISRFG